MTANNAALTMARSGIKTVLLVDDDAGLRFLLGAELEADGYRVVDFGDAESALQQPLDDIDLAVVDYHLQGQSGLELLRSLRSRDRVPALIITSERAVHHDPDWPTPPGATRLLTKPFRLKAFRDSIERLCDISKTVNSSESI